MTYPEWWSIIDYKPSTYLGKGDVSAEFLMAFSDYTFGGPIELMALKSLTQAGLGTFFIGTGIYATLGTAALFELAMDFLILGTAVTLVDPSHKWRGGVDDLAIGVVEATPGMDWSKMTFGTVV